MTENYTSVETCYRAQDFKIHVSATFPYLRTSYTLRKTNVYDLCYEVFAELRF